MNVLDKYREHYERVKAEQPRGGLDALREKAFREFNEKGIPTSRHEEWKYTRVGTLFGKDYSFALNGLTIKLSKPDIEPHRLPGYESANELVFLNGVFSPELSDIRDADLLIQSLDEAAGGEHAALINEHLGHSANLINDGLNALNTSFMRGGIFILVKKKQTTAPVYIYHINDGKGANVLSQPRSLIYLEERGELVMAETFITLGQGESLTNGVMEIVTEQDARLELYRLQNDSEKANQVSTTHIRQIGKSHTHTVTISLNGGLVRNNLNLFLEADGCEAHLFGLYFQDGKSHIDNHTVVNNVRPNCYSNELYKGVLNDNATGVFNGKIFVQQAAQKTNAYQSNKNILLSDSASVNTKPQLEIFADDVKCSHGCTVGQLDGEALFYLQSRGIGEAKAKALLVHAFAEDILEHIKPEPLRNYVEQLITSKKELELA